MKVLSLKTIIKYIIAALVSGLISGFLAWWFFAASELVNISQTNNLTLDFNGLWGWIKGTKVGVGMGLIIGTPIAMIFGTASVLLTNKFEAKKQTLIILIIGAILGAILGKFTMGGSDFKLINSLIWILIGGICGAVSAYSFLKITRIKTWQGINGKRII